METNKTANEISRLILDSAFEVHNSLGPGLLESIYESCLAHELEARGLTVERQKPVPVIYKGMKMDCGYRLDLCVDGKVIVELKSVDEISRICLAQMITYLKVTGLNLGLILNFNTSMLKDGIKRVIHGQLEAA
jgi:GxxExxY protein